MVLSPPPISPFLSRLRAETQTEHAAIHGALRLDDDALTRHEYRHVLERFLGFYGPLEAGLRTVAGWSAWGIDLDTRTRASHLVADLRALGVHEPTSLPTCTALPPHATLASGFGCLYVLEGSTLGGQVLGRHLRRVLGLTPESGARFFHGHGDQTGALWQEFRAALDRFAASEETQNTVILAAAATFRALRRWCKES